MSRSISRTAARAVAATLPAMLVVAIATPALAHHAGGIGNALGAGPIITDPASTLDEGHSVAAVTLDYQSLGGLSTETLLSATAAMPPGSPESNNVHDLRTIQAFALSYAYGVTNDFTVAVRLPYVKRTGIREAVEQDNGDLEVENFGTADGIGDLTLFGQYRFFHQDKTELAVLFGLKTPTGRTNDLTLQGQVFDAEFQPGSGSWDPLLGWHGRIMRVRGRSTATCSTHYRPKALRTPFSATAFSTISQYRIDSRPSDPANIRCSMVQPRMRKVTKDTTSMVTRVPVPLSILCLS